MINPRHIFRRDAFRYAVWVLLVIFFILVNWALITNRHLHLLLVSILGILFSSLSIFCERLNFKHGDYTEPVYTSRVLRPIALLTISLGLAVLALFMMSDILN